MDTLAKSKSRAVDADTSQGTQPPVTPKPSTSDKSAKEQSPDPAPAAETSAAEDGGELEELKEELKEEAEAEAEAAAFGEEDFMSEDRLEAMRILSEYHELVGLHLEVHAGSERK